MKKNIEAPSEDETRAAIVAKIEAKRSAAEKITVKKTNLIVQVAVYENAIVAHEAKLRAAKERLELYRESVKTNTDDEVSRLSEAEHMQEILDRYDAAVLERMEKSRIMLERMEAIPDWFPGMDEELKGAVRRDPEYKQALERKLYLDQVIEVALSDVRKIYSARGEVSEINAKGRADV